MLDLNEGRGLILIRLVLSLLLLLDRLLGGSLDLFGRGLVGVISIGHRVGGLLALGRGPLLGGWLGGTSLTHDLLSDLTEGDGGGVGVLETGHLGELVPFHLSFETVSHDLDCGYFVAIVLIATAGLMRACWFSCRRASMGKSRRQQHGGRQTEVIGLEDDFETWCEGPNSEGMRLTLGKPPSALRKAQISNSMSRLESAGMSIVLVVLDMMLLSMSIGLGFGSDGWFGFALLLVCCWLGDAKTKWVCWEEGKKLQ